MEHYAQSKNDHGSDHEADSEGDSFELLEAPRSSTAARLESHAKIKKRFSINWKTYVAIRADIQKAEKHCGTCAWQRMTSGILARSDHVFLTQLTKLLKQQRVALGLERS